MSNLFLPATLVLLTLPAFLARWGRSVAPQVRARLQAGVLAAGLGFLALALLSAAAPTVVCSVRHQHLDPLCELAASHAPAGGAFTGWLALALALVLVGAAARGIWKGWRTQRDLRVESWIGAHDAFGAHELVVLPSETPIAITVPGRPGQIVLSRGILDTLDSRESSAVLRHEEAHLNYRHWRYFAVCSAAAASVGWMPFVGRSVGALRLSLEQWADRVAAESLGTGAPVASALRLIATAPPLASNAMSFSPVETVAARLRALENPQVSGVRRKLAAAAVVSMAVASMLFGLSAATDAISHTSELAAVVPFCLV